METRPATPADVAQIADLHVRAWQVGYRGQLPQSVLDGLAAEHRVPRWTATIAQAAWPGRGTLVADDGGEVVGFADLRPTRDPDDDPTAIGEIASFYVVPSRWGRGVGRRLMAEALTRFREAGFATASLWVLDTNDRAIGFYVATGWHPDGARKPDVVGDVVIHDVRYRRPLG